MHLPSRSVLGKRPLKHLTKRQSTSAMRQPQGQHRPIGAPRPHHFLLLALPLSWKRQAMSSWVMEAPSRAATQDGSGGRADGAAGRQVSPGTAGASPDTSQLQPRSPRGLGRKLSHSQRGQRKLICTDPAVNEVFDKCLLACNTVTVILIPRRHSRLIFGHVKATSEKTSYSTKRAVTQGTGSGSWRRSLHGGNWVSREHTVGGGGAREREAPPSSASGPAGPGGGGVPAWGALGKSPFATGVGQPPCTVGPRILSMGKVTHA